METTKMNHTEMLKVSIRYNALYIPKNLINVQNEGKNEAFSLNENTSLFVANVAKLGFGLSENVLHAMNTMVPAYKMEILKVLKEIRGVDKGWTPLVKGWDTPTGESVQDHIATFFANVFNTNRSNGITLQCGHLIPPKTFPLERYNGCPFCGTPFESEKLNLLSQGSRLEILDLWTEEDVEKVLADLLTSKTALDATQQASCKALLSAIPFPSKIEIGMKETAMLVIDALAAEDRADEAQVLFKNPNDIMRYLWFKHTGYLQIVEPKTLVAKAKSFSTHMWSPASQSGVAMLQAKADLKLKYSRSECKRVANWLNNIDLPANKACESMHPKRGMWVRFIRALRLAEYSKRKGFEKLAQLMDVFYNEDYTVWQGRVDYYKLKFDYGTTFNMLKERPGMFARSLFANMLWFGPDITLEHFIHIIDKVPARLIFTLNMYAPIYFSKTGSRSVKTLGGVTKRIPLNQMLELYSEAQLKEMIDKIEQLCLDAMTSRFVSQENKNETIYIEEGLFNIPVSIGDRSDTVQDIPSALMGTKFPLQGDTVRLFMQWGNGLRAQHLDMDLSCRVAYDNHSDYCSYSQLRITGCKHSGDIINIPNKVGTAEYIDLDVNALSKSGARYVSFTCNAYSNGSITPNLVVGWMDSKYPMKVTKSGVAYDPSCVQHQVRIEQSTQKGLIFGVLDVRERQVIWLEMSFSGQVVQNLDVQGVEALLSKLQSKLNVGALLALKAEAQGLKRVDEPELADEVYDLKWAMNTAAVTKLLVD